MSVLTPVRRGGPYGWGRSLTECVNAAEPYTARHVHSLLEVLSSPARQDADVVHTSLPLARRLWKKPVVLTVHGDYGVESRLWRRLYPAAVRRADVVTVPSRFLKERLRLERAQVIPNAVFPERFRVPERPDGGTVRLVTVTKFYFEDKARGVLDLLRLVRRAGKSFDGELQLTVVGGGRYLGPVTAQARDSGGDAGRVSVRFTGFLDRPAVALEQGDVFVYYSPHDNFPISILEAMASGLPVLTNDVGAVREIIADGEDGYVAGDDAEFVDDLCRLLGDADLRRALGRRARKKVEERFSWPGVASSYMALYDDLIAGKGY